MPVNDLGAVHRPANTGILQLDGPKIEVEISVATVLSVSISSAGGSPPKPQRGFALIDTGASITAVDEGLIAALGVQPIGQMHLTTPSQAMPAWLYAVRLSFAEPGMDAVEILDVVGCTLQPQGFIALLGRNFLRDMVFVYDGPTGFFTLKQTP